LSEFFQPAFFEKAGFVNGGACREKSPEEKPVFVKSGKAFDEKKGVKLQQNLPIHSGWA